MKVFTICLSDEDKTVHGGEDKCEHQNIYGI